VQLQIRKRNRDAEVKDEQRDNRQDQGQDQGNRGALLDDKKLKREGQAGQFVGKVKRAAEKVVGLGASGPIPLFRRQ
jgi:uncharacterized protein YjbJ (UPF0337 family)